MLHSSRSLILGLTLLLSAGSTAFGAAPQGEDPGSRASAREPIVLAGPGRSVEGLAFPAALPAPSGPPARRVEAAGLDRGAVLEGDPHFLGFAAGRFYPDPAERLDVGMMRALPPAFADDRPEDVTWVYALLERRFDRRAVAELEQLGAQVLGIFPHHALVLRVPPTQLEAVASAEAVRWLGRPRPWQKLEPAVAERLAEAGQTEWLDLVVNVFDSDLCAQSERVPFGSVFESSPGGARSQGGAVSRPRSWRTNGWQQLALEQRGATVLGWRERIHAFNLRLPASRVQEVAALDFVAYVERLVPVRSTHEESIPMIAGDITRQDYDGDAGAGVSVGIVDTGVHTAHAGLDHMYGVGWDFSGDLLADPWIDVCGHGSHVAGTIFGNGSVAPTYQGMVPDVGQMPARRVFNAKIFDTFCNGAAGVLDDVLEKMHTGYLDASFILSPPPAVICNSWTSDVAPAAWIGTEANARTLDSEVYEHRQLYVFAAGNDGGGDSTMGVESSAKNVLAVGNVVPFPTSGFTAGLVAPSSSRGPCGDGRFKPNVCAPGTSILSVDSLVANGYTQMSGTSMAAPHVTGLAAQLVDHYGDLADQPQALSALLMAGATSRSESIVNTPPSGGGDHLSTYGAGRVESYRSHWADADSATFLWHFDQGAVGWQELDFAVGTDAERLVMTMMYLEPAASAGASRALLADIDSWLDVEPFEAGGPSGDFALHQSSRDNIEIATIQSPSSGNWRVKVVPTEFFIQPRRVAVCVMVDYGKTHPDTTVSLSADTTCVQPGMPVRVTARVDAPTFVSSAMFAWINAPGATILDVTTPMPGVGTASHLDNPAMGAGVTLGDVVHGIPREVTWTLRWANEGGPNLVAVTTDSENTDDQIEFLSIAVDGTPPIAPQNLDSPTHPPPSWSNEPTIVYEWDPALDEWSDIAGYSWNSGPAPEAPDTTVDLGPEAKTTSEPAVESDGSWYFTIRAVDSCGHWGPHATLGPIRVDLTRPNGPWDLESSSHAPGVPSQNQTVSVSWTAANDDLSGLAGYRAVWSHDPNDPLGGPANLGASATSASESLALSEEPWYFHLVALDVAGNRGEPMSFGPLLVYGPAGTTFCPGDGSGAACPCGNAGGPVHGCGNSFTSLGARLVADGVASLAVDTVVLHGFGMPDTPSLYFQGTSPVAGGAGLVFGDGLRCVGGAVTRLAVKQNQSNQSAFPEPGDLALSVAGGVNLAGTTLYYQSWYRDPQSTCSDAGFNLTNGVQVTWWP